MAFHWGAPQAKTAGLGPITRPIWKTSLNDTFINEYDVNYIGQYENMWFPSNDKFFRHCMTHSKQIHEKQ
jgi:hypothetical protein